MTVTPEQFHRVYVALYGPMPLRAAERAVARIEGRAAGKWPVPPAEQAAYTHAATAQCRFCLGLPVANAAMWSDPDAPIHAPCPRCGATTTPEDPMRDAALAYAREHHANKQRLAAAKPGQAARLAAIAEWLERDRREPDKILCHVASLRRAITDLEAA